MNEEGIGCTKISTQESGFLDPFNIYQVCSLLKSYNILNI